ncbi:MAG: LicD family protein [Lachnospiraceae bacterium]|nr:LicD family protein [Lachnospiraceae bacterium]
MNTLENFSLEEEVICDHLVTSDTKKLWAVEMDLALQLDRICRKHGIPYYAAGGTLIGAVRHKGFIPWDNDMDFEMLKEDYDRFRVVAPKELEDPYVFHETFGVARIRNRNTTAVTKNELETALPPYDLGIFIDIFPLFNIPNSKLEQKKHFAELKFLRMIRSGQKQERVFRYKTNKSLKDHLQPKRIAWKICSSAYKSKDLSEEHRRLCSKYKESEYVGLSGFLPYDKRFIWRRSCFEGTIEMPFETITLPAPKGYDEILKTTYGDYMVPVKGNAFHETMIFDTERPCSYYASKMTNTREI